MGLIPITTCPICQGELIQSQYDVLSSSVTNYKCSRNKYHFTIEECGNMIDYYKAVFDKRYKIIAICHSAISATGNVYKTGEAFTELYNKRNYNSIEDEELILHLPSFFEPSIENGVPRVDLVLERLKKLVIFK
jgi:hypothetical protein